MPDTDGIAGLAEQATAQIAAADSLDTLERIRLKYLGRTGILTVKLREVGSLPADRRPVIGRLVQRERQQLQQALNERLSRLRKSEQQRQLSEQALDVTLAGRSCPPGSIHVIHRIMRTITDWFSCRGYAVAAGPEVEDEWHNFTALNLPAEHPARDMHDTFYFRSGNLLRTHTSPVQIRTMLSSPPPLHIICPGKVYRRDSDLTHTPMFHQVEGLVVDTDTSFAQLKGTLRAFLTDLFGADIKMRFRASYFPFTEPSAEVDISCVRCSGGGCRICKDGWLEVLGSGMVHPNVLRNCGLDPQQWRGFAFGFGVERLAMLLYGLDDMRLNYENDLRFLSQF